MRHSKSLILAAAMGLMASVPGGMAHAAPVPRVSHSSKVKRGLWTGDALPNNSTVPGHKPARISMAPQQRNSKKTRNIKRHRAACRG